MELEKNKVDLQPLCKPPQCRTWDSELRPLRPGCRWYEDLGHRRKQWRQEPSFKNVSQSFCLDANHTHTNYFSRFWKTKWYHTQKITLTAYMLKFWIDFVLVLAFPCEKGSMKKVFFPLNCIVFIFSLSLVTCYLLCFPSLPHFDLFKEIQPKKKGNKYTDWCKTF